MNIFLLFFIKDFIFSPLFISISFFKINLKKLIKYHSKAHFHHKIFQTFAQEREGIY
jgi:hypothetical protein